MSNEVRDLFDLALGGIEGRKYRSEHRRHGKPHLGNPGLLR